MKRYSLHKFSSKDDMPFNPESYSRLKHGSVITAKEFGTELADGFFKEHASDILSSQVLVMESSYSHIKNAASLITDRFVNRLNILIAECNGHKCQRMKINRSLPYISDYGKLDQDQRTELLRLDEFSFDHRFTFDKLMLFIDDVIITGSHERKIEEMLQSYNIIIPNCYAVYYAELLTGNDTNPDIEAFLNNCQIHDLTTLTSVLDEKNSELIVRPLKMILGWPDEDQFLKLLSKLTHDQIESTYQNCLGEGYHQNPSYSRNFSLLRERYYKKFH